MTMHLLPPMYSTTGKKKGKQKWATAEQKRKAQELDMEWQKKQQEWASISKPKVKPVGQAVKYKMPTIPEGRQVKGVSLDTGVKGAVTVKKTQHYTGDRLLGITIMHKSCLQPVFSQEQAVDAAHMRR
jgi:hypothetical protein